MFLIHRSQEGVFCSALVLKFINHLSFTGSNFKIEKLVYIVFYFLKKKLKCCPKVFFAEVFSKARTAVGLKLSKKKQRKKKVIKVVAEPFTLSLGPQYKKVIYWLTRSIRNREESFLALKIFKEFYEIAFLNTGVTLKKRKEYYQYAVLFKMNKRFKW